MPQSYTFTEDVESLQINDGANSWERQRSPLELSSLRERLLARVGELDPSEYEFTA